MTNYLLGIRRVISGLLMCECVAVQISKGQGWSTFNGFEGKGKTGNAMIVALCMYRHFFWGSSSPS